MNTHARARARSHTHTHTHTLTHSLTHTHTHTHTQRNVVVRVLFFPLLPPKLRLRVLPFPFSGWYFWNARVEVISLSCEPNQGTFSLVRQNRRETRVFVIFSTHNKSNTKKKKLTRNHGHCYGFVFTVFRVLDRFVLVHFVLACGLGVPVMCCSCLACTS